ncbi:Inner membrane transport permease YbhR [Bremerella volcania]|uniref:Inner membrane transport permease YbhR n=1 Tax=Bremerella volcania TaxID=2527984 RepID=A0A518CGA5_9BACT|nr:ABC transporter permease [Bremerella volcania]QDU78259.1 Inner membrane transport permease YbhR [Bremerella volcania]
MTWSIRPLTQLVIARLKEFYREPEAVFWVYGFPILMTVALGVAFREQPEQTFRVEVIGSQAEVARTALGQDSRFHLGDSDEEAAKERLRTGRTDLVVTASGTKEFDYLLVPTRPESQLARNEVDLVLQAAAGRVNAAEVTSTELSAPGGRYIDFLVPGLLGMGLMGGGLWGLGFVVVDMRLRKLLKRFLATPMRKTDFLASLMISRLIFMVPEVLLLLVFAWLVFGVQIAGNLLTVVFFILLGAVSFAGLGLLIACRAKTLETVSGLMNLVMLPMWVLSGIFFSRERFPEFLQPAIRLLPLTALNDALRGVMLEGVGLFSLAHETIVLVLWGVVSFVVALRFFRWH